MYAVTSLQGLSPGPSGRRVVLAATVIAPAPVLPTDPLYVVVPSLGNQRWGPCAYSPHDTALPTKGTRCGIVIDESDNAWVAGWEDAPGTPVPNIAGAELRFRAGDYRIQNSLDARGHSTLTIRGQGIDATTLTATANLDGSDLTTRNAVLNLNNATAAYGSYLRTVVIEDLTIDCTLQNGSGIPGGLTFGDNLCAIECQNVDRVLVRRVRFIKAYGNAIAVASINPSTTTPVIDCVVEDCIFEDCVQNTLPQYGGITGSVLQFGANVSAEVRGNKFYRSGGPAVDAFNAVAAHVHHNYFEGVASTPIGNGQTMNSIRSDFGLVGCDIHDNTLNRAGVIQLNGIMAPNALNAMVGTPGPFASHVHHNRIIGTGTTPLAAPTVAASTTTYSNSCGAPVLVTVTGGAGILVLVNGSVVTGSGQSGRQWLIPTGGTIRLDYTSVPTWTWQRAPNASLPAIGLLAGNAAGQPLGLVDASQITDNIVIDAPGAAIQLYDGRRCVIKGNTCRNPAEWIYGYPAIQALDSNAVSGCGTQECDFVDNVIADTRTQPCVGAAFQNNTANCVNNAYRGNRIPVGVPGLQSTVARAQVFWEGNYSGSTLVRASVPVIASASTLALPDVGSDLIQVTGTTSVTGIFASQPGRTVTLEFVSGLSMFNGGNLILASNYTAPATGTITLSCDGINWFEDSRSPN